MYKGLALCRKNAMLRAPEKVSRGYGRGRIRGRGPRTDGSGNEKRVTRTTGGIDERQAPRQARGSPEAWASRGRGGYRGDQTRAAGRHAGRRGCGDGPVVVRRRRARGRDSRERGGLFWGDCSERGSRPGRPEDACDPNLGWARRVRGRGDTLYQRGTPQGRLRRGRLASKLYRLRFRAGMHERLAAPNFGSRARWVSWTRLSSPV
jgi:hypothetical protein